MLEREIKLRFESVEDARRRVLDAGAVPVRARRLQSDSLLDTPDRSLGRRSSVLRLRVDDDRAFVTFKGPVQPGVLKVREEHETTVGDPAAVLTILRSLGLDIWFRYEKYREEYAVGDLIVAVDETPVGVFVELEGDEDGIHRFARALGCVAADYLTTSYRTLFLEAREASGGTEMNMLFGSRDGR